VIKSVSNHPGVRCITNNITINNDSDDKIEKDEIIGALARNWSIDDQNIRVQVSGNCVTLNGTVQSWYDKDEAARIAWNAPGVWEVTNDLIVNVD
jgi:osmotically-inducible protein OsmY